MQTPNEATEPDKETVQELKKGNKICDHCGAVYIYSTTRHRFCSDKCRLENWTQTHDTEFKPRKRKSQGKAKPKTTKTGAGKTKAKASK